MGFFWSGKVDVFLGKVWYGPCQICRYQDETLVLQRRLSVGLLFLNDVMEYSHKLRRERLHMSVASVEIHQNTHIFTHTTSYRLRAASGIICKCLYNEFPVLSYMLQ